MAPSLPSARAECVARRPNRTGDAITFVGPRVQAAGHAEVLTTKLRKVCAMREPSSVISTATFAVASFKRVFDIFPEQEVLSLSDLVACFRRFELKPQLFTKIERECARIEQALGQVDDPIATGERVVALRTAGEQARARGEDAAAAMRAKCEELKHYARKDAKKDMRLWSPTRYQEGWKERGTDGVTHISCLVLDYDSGVRIPEARSVFGEYFHLFHTTWSHSEEHPKFRVVLPLAVSCPVSGFDRLRAWAHAKAAGEFDPVPSGPAATYALPVVRSADAPRDAGSHAGKLLDPRDLGIDVGLPPKLAVMHAKPSRMVGDPEKEYVVHETTDAVYVYDDLDEDEAWSLAPSRVSLPSLAPSVPSSIPPQSTEVLPPMRPPTLDAEGQPKKRTRARKKTIVVDFDGVLHAYTSGWKGATAIPDPPVADAFPFLRAAVERFDVAILSARSREPGGINAMKAWLTAHGLEDETLGKLKFPQTKPPAHVYLDDRGWRFDGIFPPLDAIDAFEPWYKTLGSADKKRG